MHATIRAALACLFLPIAACDRPDVPPPEPPTHEEYRAALAGSALAGTLLGRGWLEAADSAVAAPAVLPLPHHERGVFLPAETRSIGIAFDAVEGQSLRIGLGVSGDSTGRLFADLYFVEPGSDPGSDPGSARHVTSLADVEGDRLPIEESGRYVLRLQPELLASIDYRLQVELDAALAFPVSGYSRRNVGSIFGDPRDAGRRRHEGIDIFAPRATPVVAVVDGVAIARMSDLGGNTVWLRGGGTSYYYAHLDEVAIDGRQRVDAGDVLGFVGNTGNAATTPPHLHFGMYRRGRGALDPLPYVISLTYAEPPAAVFFDPAFVAVTASGLNLRPGPGTLQAPLGSLAEAALLRVVGATEDWLRVRTIGGQGGWIHRDYQDAVAAAQPSRQSGGDAWLLSAPRIGVPVARVRPGMPLHLFAEAAGWQLVGDTAERPLGWVAAQPAPARSAIAGGE